MPMLEDPSKKYQPFKPLNLPNRQWPSKVLNKAPRWLATDLRDGNQALVDPMDGDQKLRYFTMLCELGYKEIEVSFPSASDTDFNFTRYLVQTPGVTPDDVWLQVLAPCRPELIERTVASLKGAKKAILHLYLATSECFRRIVFGYTPEECLELAVKCTKMARAVTKDDPAQAGTEWAYEFSPETFSDTDPDFALRVCEAVKAAWEPSAANPIIFNLPATVEMSTPNVYADQIEHFCTHISEREKVCVSLHPHNDRGCAVAAAELGQMAGADRVEGVLCGNGERTGNVDLVTLALNLYTSGTSPRINFSELNDVVKAVEECTRIPVHPRAAYAGQLVVCAFSGSHQDAIKKGFVAREKEGRTREDPWQMPYLPLDPKDIGRTYEAIIRINSQSGKGGVAWVIRQALELDLPRGLQIAFSRIVQRKTDEEGRELRPREVVDLFEKAYHLGGTPRFVLLDYNIGTDRGRSPSPAPGRSQNTRDLMRIFDGVVSVDGTEHHIKGKGNGPISSLANALRPFGLDMDVANYSEHGIGAGRDVKAATFFECSAAGIEEKIWGVGIHEDAVQASLLALLWCAESFLAGKKPPSMPIRPKQENLNPNIRPLMANGTPKSGPDAASTLEAKLTVYGSKE